MSNNNKSMITIGAISGAVIIIVVVVVVLVIVLSKKKTSSSATSLSTTSSAQPLYVFPVNNAEHIAFNENIPTATQSELTNDTGVSLWDANWCDALSQRWVFEYVQDGSSADTKVYKMRVGSNYLTYSSGANYGLTMAAATSDTTQYWAVKNLPGVTPVRIYSGNSAITIGVFNITSVAAGTALSYDSTTSNPIMCNLQTINATDAKQRWSIHQNTC
jgi:hypothetical protein